MQNLQMKKVSLAIAKRDKYSVEEVRELSFNDFYYGYDALACF